MILGIHVTSYADGHQRSNLLIYFFQIATGRNQLVRRSQVAYSTKIWANRICDLEILRFYGGWQ